MLCRVRGWCPSSNEHHQSNAVRTYGGRKRLPRSHVRHVNGSGEAILLIIVLLLMMMLLMRYIRNRQVVPVVVVVVVYFLV
jgi:hypothetical protein